MLFGSGTRAQHSSNEILQRLIDLASAVLLIYKPKRGLEGLDHELSWHDSSFFPTDHEQIIKYYFELGGAGKNEVGIINFDTELEEFEDDVPILLEL